MDLCRTQFLPCLSGVGTDHLADRCGDRVSGCATSALELRATRGEREDHRSQRRPSSCLFGYVCFWDVEDVMDEEGWSLEVLVLAGAV